MYEGWDQKYSQLQTTLELMKVKASNGLYDKGFNDLLSLLKDMLLKPNCLMTTITYEAKKIICPLGMEVKKIHIRRCCILYKRVC